MSDRHGRRRRAGLTGFVRNIVDDTQDFLDGCLDRTGDIEHDLRKAVSDNLRCGDRDGRRYERDSGPPQDGDDSRKLHRLKSELADLRETLDQLAVQLEYLGQAGTRSPKSRQMRLIHCQSVHSKGSASDALQGGVLRGKVSAGPDSPADTRVHRLDRALVVQTIRWISASNCRNSAQVFSHNRTIAGYFCPHSSLNSRNQLAAARPAAPGEHLRLLDRRAVVPGPCQARGRRHPHVFVLAPAACAVLSDEKSPAAITERAAGASAAVLTAPGGPGREPTRPHRPGRGHRAPGPAAY